MWGEKNDCFKEGVGQEQENFIVWICNKKEDNILLYEEGGIPRESPFPGEGVLHSD